MTSRREMDALVELHLAAERAGDSAASVSMYSDDVEHDVVGWPTGPVVGPERAKSFYDQLGAIFDNRGMDPVRSLHGEDFCVVEHRTTGVFADGFAGAPGSDQPVTFRMLHIWEFHDGLISRENVWLDAGAIAAQLLAAQ